jgi:hypothetical protein
VRLKIRKFAPARPPDEANFRIAALAAAAVAIPTLVAQTLLEPVDLDPQLRELAAAQPVAAGPAEPVPDLVGFAAQTERLARRDYAAPRGTGDALIDLVELPQQLTDGAAIGAAMVIAAATVVAMFPAAVVVAILGGSRNSGQRGGRSGDRDEQFTHIDYSLLHDCRSRRYTPAHKAVLNALDRIRS